MSPPSNWPCHTIRIIGISDSYVRIWPHAINYVHQILLALRSNIINYAAKGWKPCLFLFGRKTCYVGVNGCTLLSMYCLYRCAVMHIFAYLHLPRISHWLLVCSLWRWSFYAITSKGFSLNWKFTFALLNFAAILFQIASDWYQQI